MVTRSTSSFGLVGTDWQQRINWERLRKYRLNRARDAMKQMAWALYWRCTMKTSATSPAPLRPAGVG